MPPFQIPNQQSYFPALPPRPDDTDTSQADEQVYPAQRLDLSPEENQQMLMRAFMERINAQPPAPPPPVTLSPKQRFGLGMMSGPLQQVMLKRLMEQQPGYQDYAQKEAGFKAGQEQLGEIGQVMGSMQRTGAANERLNMNLWQNGAVNTIDKATGANVTMLIRRNRMTGEVIDSQGNPVDQSTFVSPIHWQVAYDESGNAMQVPTSPLPPGQKPSTGGIIPSGTPNQPIGQGGGAANKTPAPYDKTTRPLGFKRTPVANLQGIQQQLDNAELMLNEMRSNWLQRPSSALRQGIGTASANLLSRGVGANLGLSGAASAIDPHAVIHERDREAIATTLSFPLSGSRRGMEGARQSLLGIIPHYTDPPEVWDAFDQQMRALIANSRRMPWGTAPDDAAKQYEPAFDQFLAQVSYTPAPKGPYTGKTLPRQIFDGLPPSEQQRFINGGGQVGG